MARHEVPGVPRVLALFGPTGVGKTEVAIELGKHLSRNGSGAVAINCDSMQVYSGIGLLAGAPSNEQQREMEHRLVGFVPLECEFSVGEFAPLARAEIDQTLATGHWPIVVGGTGLYMRAALTDLDLKPRIPRGLEEQIALEIEEHGLEAVHSQLPDEVAETVHPNDRKRVLRYSALARIGRRPAPPSTTGGELWSAPARRPTSSFGLLLDRERLEVRIRERVMRMAELGAEEEARSALSSGPSRTAAKAIGLEEFAKGDLHGAVRKHLRFARRQETWLRRMEGVTIIDREDLSDGRVAALILDSLDGQEDREA